MAEPGQKHDGGKDRWDLVQWRSLSAYVRVLTFGAAKYAPDNWRNVANARARYIAAALRHITARAQGQRVDPETGENHLAHAVCCLAFLLELDEEATHG